MRRGILGFFLCALLGVIGSLWLPSSHASAAVGINPTLTFQGKVVNTNGTNIADGNYNMEFKIYQDGTNNGTGSTLKWTEDYLVGGTPVTVTNGTFSVNLGSLTSFGASVDWNQSVLWLSMQLGNTSSCTITTNFQSNCSGDGEMTPFIRLTSSPYALNADKLDGIDSTAFAQLTANQTFVGNDIFKSATNSTTAFQIQNSSSVSILNVDTTDGNLITNPGFEVNATGWAAAGTTAPTRDTTNKYLGFASGTVSGVTAAGEGFKQVLSTTLSNGTYTISWYDRMISGPAFTDVIAAYSTTGGAPTNCTGINSQTVVSTGWTRHWCQISVSGASAANYITIRQVGASTARTWNIDAIQLESGSVPTGYAAGSMLLNANITSPLTIKNIENSTTALTVENAAGTDIFNIDTLNSIISATADLTVNAQSDLRFADSDSSNWVAFQAPATVSSNVTWSLPSSDSAGCLQSDGSGALSFAACGDTNIQTFSSNGTYTVPTNALMVIVETWGGGGGGGGGAGGSTAAVRSGGAGGGGGAYNIVHIAASTLGVSGSTIQATIGAAGTAGNAGSSGNGTDGGAGGRTCFSTSASCAGTIYLSSYGGGGGNGDGTAGSGGGGGGGALSTGTTNGTAATGGTGGGPLGAAANAQSSGAGGAGGGTAAATGAAGGYSSWGGGGGGSSSSTGAGNSGAGGGSVLGGAGGGGGGTCAITTCTLRQGGAGGSVPGTTGGGGTAGTTAGQAGGAGGAGQGSGGDGGGGGANNAAGTGGAGGVGGARGGGGGGGGAGETTTGGAGGAGGAGYLRAWTMRGSGADLAEIYGTRDSSIEPGDVVCLDPDMIAGVKKSSKAYQTTAFGIISTMPSMVMGDLSDPNAIPVPVALSGRVPVKVNLENGPIKAGDYLTPSSTPGVAMKATKAGQVIGQAMISFNDLSLEGQSNRGLILAFVKNQQGNGSSMSDLVTGVNTSNDDSQSADLSKLMLANMVTNRVAVAEQDDISEINADRVMAGLEVITPTVISDTVKSNSLKPSTGQDLSIELETGNKFVVKKPDGTVSFSVDSTGGAQFTNDLIALANVNVKGALSLDGNSTFNGEATFGNLATFLNDLVIKGNVDAQGRITFNNDSGGFAVVSKGSNKVKVTFKQPFKISPVITASIYVDSSSDGSSLDSVEQDLFTQGYNFILSDVGKNGFTIVLNKPTTQDVKFSWNAVSVESPNTIKSPPDTYNPVQ